MAEYALKLSEAELARYRFMAEAALRMEADLWASAGIVQGAAVADVGCGPGAVSLVMSRLVGPAGRVEGVDGDEGVIEAARAGAEQAGQSNVTFGVGRADDSGLAPESFDTVMIRHVLAHNGGAEQAIVDHAASLLRPGGHVYLADIDATTFRTRPFDADLADLNDRYFAWHERQGNDLSVGLRLAELLIDAGLELVDFQGRYQIIPVPVGLRPPSWAALDAMIESGMAAPDDVTRWEAAFERMDSSPTRPTFFFPLFFAFARKPGGDQLRTIGIQPT